MNRQEIEALPTFPFTDYRSNDSSFLLLELYWPAVISAAIGPEASAQAVPLAEADQDTQGFGTPTLLSFWIPKRGRGVRILGNDPPDDKSAPHSRLFASASIYERPPAWELPTAGQIAGPVTRMEELVFIADPDPEVADAIAETCRRFLLSDISLSEMSAYCSHLEATWLAR